MKNSERFNPSLTRDELELLDMADFDFPVESRSKAAKKLCEAGLLERHPARKTEYRRTKEGNQVLKAWRKAKFV